MYNKNGQIGETMTWVVATVIIIVVLGVTIFLASVYLEKDKVAGSDYFKFADTLASKSLFSYTLTEDSSGQKVYGQFKSEDNLNEFNGNLGLKIFSDLFQEYYLDNPTNIWFGFVINTGENLSPEKEPSFDILDSPPNTFFGDRPGGERGTAISYHILPHVSEKIKLDDEKSVELILIGR